MHMLRDWGLWVALVSVLGVWPSGEAAHARQPASSVFSDVARSAWYDINSLLLAAAKKMPDQHYSFRPVKQAKSFSEIIGHIADEHYAICGAVTGRSGPATQFEKQTSKDALVSALQDSIAICDLAYGLLTDENAAFRYAVFDTVGTRLSLLTAILAHDNEHYGNLATYMRIKGVEPPGGGQ
jgi:uncharacterized damage-inducible protein DinB